MSHAWLNPNETVTVGMDYIAMAQTSWPLLVGGYGGRFAPIALAQILFGEVSPSGKLAYCLRSMTAPVHRVGTNY